MAQNICCFQASSNEYGPPPFHSLAPNALFQSPHYPVSSSSAMEIAPSHHQSLTTLHHPYAPSYTPSRQPGGGEATLPSRGRTNSSTASSYNQLQYPTASNYGSMKKRKRGGGGGGGDQGGSVTSPSPLPTSTSVTTSASLPHLEREHLHQDQDVRIWSVQYVPELYTVDRSLQRRPKKVVKV